MKAITCANCQEHYTQPKVLPCLHYFYCKQWILKLALRTGKDKPFSWPKCRKEATLPWENEDNLQTAFFVRFKALYDKQGRALSKEEVKCEISTNSQIKAEAFCQHCDKFVCEECIKSHQRMKAIFDGHGILSLDEVKKASDAEVFTKNPAIKVPTSR